MPKVIRHIQKIHHWLKGTHLTQDLPKRVQDTINAQQDASEILIGWTQLAFILTMATLYAISPKAFSEEIMFTPVPWAIFLYSIFTITRLILAYLRKLPDWLLWLSVIIDIALLLSLIFTFHIQYDQPPSFYLKSPTLLYVFIFIAIRSLRFDPGFVILSGAVAIVGWLFMAGYAVVNMTPGAGVTRNYVEYMTSNHILIGAEFDKIISIFVVTLVLSIGITRARKRLVTAITEQAIAEDLSRFLPEEIVTQITHSATRLEAGFCEEREATIMYIDIESFTSIGESLQPDELVKTLNEYFSSVAEPIARYGGVICQFQGDAILASFNLPKEDTAHAENAIRSAFDILKLLREKRFGKDVVLNARIGINTGTVVGGLVGTKQQLGYTIHGNHVNLAARLEQLNKKTNTRLLIENSTYQKAPNCHNELMLVGDFEIRGRSTKTRVFTNLAN
jgi:adenylate cyclase